MNESNRKIHHYRVKVHERQIYLRQLPAQRHLSATGATYPRPADNKIQTNLIQSIKCDGYATYETN